MKLSDLSTDKAMDVLCELTPYIGSIANDKEVVSAIGKVMKGGQDINRYGQAMLLLGRVGDFLPLLLKNHRADVYGILSVMNERPVAEIASQKLMDTMGQFRELLRDEEFVGFFKSSARQAQSGQSAPSASFPA